MKEPGHFCKQCRLELDFDQSEFSEGLDHQCVILLRGVRRHPVMYMWVVSEPNQTQTNPNKNQTKQK